MLFPLLPPRPADSHKAMFGRVGLVGGAPGTVGALLLAGRASLGCGAGLVTLGVLDDAVRVDFATPELMFAPPKSLVTDLELTVLAIGPGLGQSRQSFELMQAALLHPALLIIDADGLNLLSRRGDLAYLCARRAAHTLLTPHPGEAARLLQVGTREIQANRELAARELALRYNALYALVNDGAEFRIIGIGEGIMIDRKSKTIYGASDPRGGGLASGYYRKSILNLPAC